LIVNSTTATQLRTGPSTFGSDGGYSSIMLIAEQTSGAGDKAGLVSRGMVIYSGSTKVAAIVRAPEGAYGTIEFPTGTYILISSVTGRVRADGGFEVAGNLGLGTSAAPVTIGYVKSAGGNGTLTFRGGLLTAQT
jgi:hypothetical protein